MNRSILTAAVATGLVLLAGTAHGYGSTAESPRMYYEMGGGEPIREPTTTVPLPSVSISQPFKTLPTCGLWDLRHEDLDAYAQMVVDHVDGTADRLGEAILVNIVGLAEGLLAAAIQRAMPGMYDLAQQVHAQLMQRITLAKQRCEAVARKVGRSNSPLGPWRDASDRQAWSDALGVSGTDETGAPTFTVGAIENVLQAERAIAQNNGATSVPWFGGKRGGEGADPILIVHDTVQAGYALVGGSAATAEAHADARVVTYTNPVNGTAVERPSRLGALWGDAAAAIAWAQRVLGERTIGFCETCEATQQGGSGLLAAYYAERRPLETAWQGILANATRPTIAQLGAVSSGSVHLTAHVTDAIRQLPAQDQRVYVERLIADVAIARTAEKAMALRRILRAAETTPEVQAYPHVQTEVQGLQAELRADLEEVFWELDMNRRLGSETAAALVSYDGALNHRALQIPRGIGRETTGDESVEIASELGPAPVLREGTPGGESAGAEPLPADE